MLLPLNLSIQTLTHNIKTTRLLYHSHTLKIITPITIPQFPLTLIIFTLFKIHPNLHTHIIHTLLSSLLSPLFLNHRIKIHIYLLHHTLHFNLYILLNPYLHHFFQSNNTLLLYRLPFFSDPIKLFDGLDHTYLPEKVLAPLSARLTFQLGPQPLDQQSYLTWHSRRMSVLCCSFTGTASNWYNRLPQVYKSDWSAFLQIFQKQFYSQKHAYHALTLVKKHNENVRHFALKVETLVKQGWYNEYPSTIIVVFLKS